MKLHALLILSSIIFSPMAMSEETITQSGENDISYLNYLTEGALPIFSEKEILRLRVYYKEFLASSTNTGEGAFSDNQERELNAIMEGVYDKGITYFKDPTTINDCLNILRIQLILIEDKSGKDKNQLAADLALKTEIQAKILFITGPEENEI